MLLIDSLDNAKQTLLVLLPELLILLAATAMMTAGAFVRLPRRIWCVLSVAVLGVALVALLGIWDEATDLYSAVALNDAFSFNARLVLLFMGFVLFGLAHDQVDDDRAAEFFGALLMINAGAMLVAAANELVFLFVGLELVSIPTYLLLYLPRRNAVTQEAATKYFFLSIFSSGLLLYGLAFLYGLTGVSNLKALAFLAEHLANALQPQLALIAVVFVIAGLSFRVAAVPFHFYAPDVYQGSPTVIAAVLAWVPKAIGFLALIRALTAVISAGGASSPVGDQAMVVAWIIAAATMTLGNAVALLQDNLKRLFAYSSIAHAGYMMVGITVAMANAPGDSPAILGTQGVLFYLVAYAVMTLGAFGIIIALSTPERPIESVNDFAGLGQTHPIAALAMTTCLLSLAGIPPLAGFFGKFFVFMSAFSAATGAEAWSYWWLAVIGVLNAAAGAYYYLRIVVLMYLRPAPPEPIQARPAWPTVAAAGACVVLTLVLGIFARPISRAAGSAAVSAVAHPDPTTVAEATASRE